MQILDCDKPLPWTAERLKALDDLCWRGGAKSTPRNQRSAARDLLYAVQRLDLEKLERAILFAKDVSPKLRDPLLELVLDLCGWLLEETTQANKTTRRDDSDVWKAVRFNPETVWRIFLPGDETLKPQIEVLDPCRVCSDDASKTTIPAKHPEFCSAECALEWLDDNATDIHRFADLDELIREAEEKAAEKAEADAKAEATEDHDLAIAEALASDDNPLMALLRRYGLAHIADDVESAAWKLECALRSGALRI